MTINTARRLMTGLLAGIFVMLLAGCQAPVKTQVTPALVGTTYPSTDPAQVQILTAAPTRPYVALGQVQALPASDNVPKEDIQAALQTAAAKLGADAVQITQDSEHQTGAFITGPWYDRTLNTVQQRVIVGEAIKYTP
ncbi:MAG: hypothetical protein ABSH19_02420 [Opitutales bacterium]